MVVTLPQRRAIGLDAPMTPVESDAWAHDVVDLRVSRKIAPSGRPFSGRVTG